MSETAMTGETMPCLWGGGNDYMACRVCHLEYDYRVAPKPPCGAADALARLTAELARLSDPLAVHINMVRGAIAKPSIENIRHIYPEIAQGEFEARCALRAAEARALTAEAERDQLKIGNRVLDEMVAEHCGKRLTAEAALAKAVEDARAEGMQIMALQADLARYEAAAPLSARETAEYLEIERRLNALRALSAPASKDGG